MKSGSKTLCSGLLVPDKVGVTEFKLDISNGVPRNCCIFLFLSFKVFKAGNGRFSGLRGLWIRECWLNFFCDGLLATLGVLEKSFMIWMNCLWTSWLLWLGGACDDLFDLNIFFLLSLLPSDPNWSSRSWCETASGVLLRFKNGNLPIFGNGFKMFLLLGIMLISMFLGENSEVDGGYTLLGYMSLLGSVMAMFLSFLSPDYESFSSSTSFVAVK